MNANWLRSENHARMTYHACDLLIARATYARTYARMCGEGICAWRIELGEPPARHHAKPIAPRTNNHVTNMCTYVRTYVQDPHNGWPLALGSQNATGWAFMAHGVQGAMRERCSRWFHRQRMRDPLAFATQT